MQVVLKRSDRVVFSLKVLEEKAFRLRREIEKINDRRKKELAQREYDRLISRINEIKNPTPLMLLRYE